MTIRRTARRAVRRALGLTTRPGCAPGEAFVFDHLARRCRAADGVDEWAAALTVAQEWEYWGMLSPEVGEEIVRAARRWPLLYRAVRSEVGAAVSKAAEREPTAH